MNTPGNKMAQSKLRCIISGYFHVCKKKVRCKQVFSIKPRNKRNPDVVQKKQNCAVPLELLFDLANCR